MGIEIRGERGMKLELNENEISKNFTFKSNNYTRERRKDYIGKYHI